MPIILAQEGLGPAPALVIPSTVEHVATPPVLAKGIALPPNTARSDEIPQLGSSGFLTPAATLSSFVSTDAGEHAHIVAAPDVQSVEVGMFEHTPEHSDASVRSRSSSDSSSALSNQLSVSTLTLQLTPEGTEDVVLAYEPHTVPAAMAATDAASPMSDTSASPQSVSTSEALQGQKVSKLHAARRERALYVLKKHWPPSASAPPAKPPPAVAKPK